ncbi:alcohol dehydrogenase catalytic domain-containing protein [Geodermatophilus sp. SYSU D00758]
MEAVPGQRSWEDVADPRLEDPEDAVVRVDAFTICGTDLHILRGDVPEVTPGTILGHEALGTVTEVGPGVRTVRPGDRVLLSCISSCSTAASGPGTPSSSSGRGRSGWRRS